MAELPAFFNLNIFLSSEPLSRIANLFFKRFSKNVGQNVYAKSRKTQSQSASLTKLIFFLLCQAETVKVGLKALWPLQSF